MKLEHQLNDMPEMQSNKAQRRDRVLCRIQAKQRQDNFSVNSDQ